MNLAESQERVILCNSAPRKKTLLVLFEKTQFPPRLVDGRPCQPWTMSCYIGARTIAASIASIVDFE